MAAPAQQEKPSAAVVGQAFAEQYYTVLHQSPAMVYRFYQDNSKLGRSDDGANMGLTTGMEAINAKILSYGMLKAEIISIDAQESYRGGVVVLITGHMGKEDDKRQGFTQTFFLAPQEVGYFVLNDIFRYLEDGHGTQISAPASRNQPHSRKKKKKSRTFKVPALAAPAQQEKPSAAVIGQVFAEQYYTVLHQSPAVVYRFYQDNSKLGRSDDGANMSLTTGMEAINAKILSYGTLKAEIISIDAQESYSGGVVVLITGHMGEEDDKHQGFTQAFFLAPQEVGYFVLNDIFRYLEDGHSQQETEDLANDMAALNTSDHGNKPVAEVVNETPTESDAVVEFETKTEEAPKKTYASIVKVLRESGTQIPAPASRKSTPKVQQHQQASATPPAAPVSENAISNLNVVEDGNNQEVEGEGFSIYVKNLPLNATPAMLYETFKTFGPIKSGGIQVRSNKGFCFGFVEFEVLDAAAQNAIEAGSIVIGGRPVVIEEKKSTSAREASSSGVNSHKKRHKVPENLPVINCEVYVNLESEAFSSRENVARDKEQVPMSPPPPPPPKEPAFSCPVCMGPLVEEMSTKCGHIFCKACIKLALAKQNKCPTCRKKMTMKDTIRVYLPTTN